MIYMWNLQLGKPEIRVFGCILQGVAGMKEIASAVGLSSNRVSEILGELEQKNFTRTVVRRPKRVAIGNGEHAAALHTLIRETGHIDWSRYLHGSAVSVLVKIAAGPDRPDRIAHGSSLKTVYNVLNRFTAIGAIRKRGRTYTMSPRYHHLKDFLLSYSRYYNRCLVREIDPGAWMIWNGGNCILIGTRNRLDDERAEITGIHAVPELFPDVISDHYLYVVPKTQPLTREEHIAYVLKGFSSEGRVIRRVKQFLKDGDNDLDRDTLHRLAGRMGVEDHIMGTE